MSARSSTTPAWRCASVTTAWPLHRALGVTASTRASFAAYTTVDEIGTFLAALDTVPAIFGTGA